MAQPPRTHEDYQIGIICALSVEKAAVEEMLDVMHPRLRINGDNNDYTLGQIEVHNVVIACLPAGRMGIGPAAVVANDMRRSFPIKFGLMVGVGGGVWSKKVDMRLGDVVIGLPEGQHGGIVQWDFGKTEKGGEFCRTGSLNKPPHILLHAVQTLKTRHWKEADKLPEYLSMMYAKKPHMAETFGHQGAEYDKLFEATYDHESDETCDQCDSNRIVARLPARKSLAPRIHYGNVASGSQVMRHGVTRDAIAKTLGVICFEMEAAGLDDFPCLVIRGICDYADSHKNKRWQPYAAATAAAFARELLSVIDEQEVVKLQPAASIKATEKITIDTVPKSQRIIEFIGRGDLLNSIATAFSGNVEGQIRIVVLIGMGGSGKTQLAMEYCRTQSEAKRPIFWTDATSKETLIQSYQRLAELISKEQKDSINQPPDADSNVQYVRQFLAGSAQSWILVFDNYDNPFTSLKDDFFPDGGHGSILVTSRDPDTRRLTWQNGVIKVAEMYPDEAIQLLLNRCGLEHTVEDKSHAQKIVQRLGCLPLAIDQAAAYIWKFNILLQNFPHHYRQHRDKILKYTPSLQSWQYRKKLDKDDFEKALSVFTTWEMSFEKLDKGDDRSIRQADALRLFGFFHWTRISEVLFQAHAERCYTKKLPIAKSLEEDSLKIKTPPYLSTWMPLFLDEVNSWSSYDFRATMADLKELHLIQEFSPDDMQPCTFSLHPLVSDWIKSRKNETGPEHYTKETIDIVTNFLDSPLASEAISETKQEVLLHLSECFQNDQRFLKGNYILSHVRSTNLFGKFYTSQGKYTEAEKMHRETLALREKVSGKEHPETLTVMNNLGLALSGQGKYAEAEKMHQETLALTEKVLGEEHPLTLWSMNNLSLALRDQGKYAKAEKMHQETLALREKVLGKEHPSTLVSMNDLGLVLSDQGKYTEAEKMHWETLALRQKVSGKEHPETLTIMNNLGLALSEQGKYAEAEKMHQETLALREKVLGKEHPLTLLSMNNLGLTLRNQGKYAKAKKIHQETLALREKVSGKEHPSTLVSMNDLGLVLSDQGKYAEAEKMYQETLALREKVSGKEHPETLTIMNNLGLVLSKQGKYAEAKKMHQETLALREKVLGKEHPFTLLSMNNLSLVLSDQKYTEAEKVTKSAATKTEDSSHSIVPHLQESS